MSHKYMTPEQKEAKKARCRKRYAEHHEERKASMRKRYAEHKEEYKARQKKYYAEHTEEHKARVKKYKAEHSEEHKASMRNSYAKHREERKAYQRRMYAEDLNKNGVPKSKIRTASWNILKKVHSKLSGYEIHHCFGYEDTDKFIYIPRKLHREIHSFLDNLGIPSAENHWNVIRDMVNSCEDYTYIRC